MSKQKFICNKLFYNKGNDLKTDELKIPRNKTFSKRIKSPLLLIDNDKIKYVYMSFISLMCDDFFNCLTEYKLKELLSKELYLGYISLISLINGISTISI